MAADGDIEIGIEASGAAVGGGLGYMVRLRHRRENDELKPVSGNATLDLGRLDEAGEKYGDVLTQQVFADPTLIQYFRDAFKSSQDQGVCLRVRLNLGRGAEPLHSLKWERLKLPWDDGSGTGRPLALNQQIFFARFLGSFDWRPVRLRRKGERLKVLVAVANPSDPGNRFGLAPIDVDAEVARARRHLGAVPPAPIEPGPDALTQIIARKPPPPVDLTVIRGADTLSQVVAALQAEEIDVLYLVCHGKLDRAWSAGSMVREESLLYLEGSESQVAPTSGGTIVARLTELTNPPRLIVLASCQSGGAGDESLSGEEGALSAIGPRLAEAGISAVLALQAALPMSTAARFFPAFFEELLRHGQVDRATAAARGRLRDTPAERDAWIPVLYTRLSHGKIWYVPGLAETPGGRDVGWDALLEQIEENLDLNKNKEIGCTPVLGFGLLEPLIGPLRDLARRWADESGFALAPHQREDLPQVAQFLLAKQRRAYLPKGLRKRIEDELTRRFGAFGGETFDDRLDLARGQLSTDLHLLLAQLPFPLYVTTKPVDQLRRALVAQGRKPRTLLFRWHERPEETWPRDLIELEPDYEPTPEKPLIYHLFGWSNLPHSLVLTEDDHFDFLTGVPGGMQHAPPVVRAALTKSSLIFLGFHVDGWDFHVLLRSILYLGSRDRLNVKLPNVAVQIAPEEGRLIDTERARDYLQKAFGQVDLTIYWGSVNDFVRDLCDHARSRGLWPWRPPGGK